MTLSTNDNPKKEVPTHQDEEQKPHKGAWGYAKRTLRDAFFLALVVGVVNWGQTFQYRGKVVAPEMFAVEWPTVDHQSTAVSQGERVTLLYVFAPWCKVCRGSADNLNNLKDSGLNVVATAFSYEKESEVQSFVKDTGLNIPVIVGAGPFEQALDVHEYPSYFFIDHKGKIIYGWAGYTTSLGLWLRIKSLEFFTSHLRA